MECTFRAWTLFTASFGHRFLYKYGNLAAIGIVNVYKFVLRLPGGVPGARVAVVAHKQDAVGVVGARGRRVFAQVARPLIPHEVKTAALGPIRALLGARVGQCRRAFVKLGRHIHLQRNAH
jgi:hypothetical protein